jgi:hypothetical protein
MIGRTCSVHRGTRTTYKIVLKITGEEPKVQLREICPILKYSLGKCIELAQNNFYHHPLIIWQGVILCKRLFPDKTDARQLLFTPN